MIVYKFHPGTDDKKHPHVVTTKPVLYRIRLQNFVNDQLAGINRLWKAFRLVQRFRVVDLWSRIHKQMWWSWRWNCHYALLSRRWTIPYHTLDNTMYTYLCMGICIF